MMTSITLTSCGKFRPFSFLRGYSAVAALAMFGLPGVAAAQTWAGTGALSGTTNDTAHSWNQDGNWSSAPFPNATGAAASLTADFTGATSVFLQQGITVGTLTLNDTGAASDVTITIATGTGANTLTFDNTASTNAVITTSGATNVISAAILLNDHLEIITNNPLTLSGVISDGGAAKAITKTNAAASSMTLSGANTYTGGTTIQRGTCYIGNNSAFGTGAVTFANEVTTGLGNSTSLNSAFSRTLANDFVLANAANLTGTQYAKIGMDGGTTGYRVLTLNGSFSSSGADISQTIQFDASGNDTGVNEGAIVVNGDWTNYARPPATAVAMRITEGGSFVIGSQNSIAGAGAATGGIYRLEGVSTTTACKIILNGAFNMANEVRFTSGGTTAGLQNSFGARNAAATTAVVSGLINNSDLRTINLFSQNATATLNLQGNLSALSTSGQVRINDSYTMTTDNAVNALQTPTGIVKLSRPAGITGNTAGVAVMNGTLLVTNTSGNGTGTGPLIIGGSGAAATGMSGSIVNANTTSITTRTISGITTATAQTLRIGQAITGTGIPTSSVITGISLGAGAADSTIVISNPITVAASTTLSFTDIATSEATTNATLGGTGIITAPTTIRAGSTIAPGLSAGTLTINNNIVIDGTYACELDGAANGDKLSVTGDLDIDGATLAVSVLGGGATGDYTIATYTGTLTGIFTLSPAPPAGYTISYTTPGEIKLIGSAAPTFFTWLPTKFSPTELTNSAISGSKADPDGDGMTNLFEFLVGTEPKTAEQSKGPVFTNPASVPTLTLVVKSSSLTSVSVVGKSGTDLTNWPDSMTLQSTPNSPNAGETTLVFQGAVPVDPRRFYHLELTTQTP